MADKIVYRRKGMHPIIAFILGILFGMMLLVGAVVAVVMVALNYKIDDIEANKDEDNNYKYVNAQEAETVMDLVSKIIELSSDQELTLGKVENLFPVAGSLTGGIIAAVEEYVPVDEAEIKNLTFSELGTYFKEKVMDIRPAALLESFGFNFGDGGEAELINLILNGKEADTVFYNNEVYPVYYETYTYDGTQYVSESGIPLNPAEVQYLNEKNGTYTMYFCETDSNRYVIAERGEDGGYTYTERGYSSFNGNKNPTGGYYTAADGTKVEIDPVTIRSFADGSAFEVLNTIVVADFIGSGDSTGLTKKLLGDITVGDIMNGRVDFEKIINTLEVAEVIDIDPTNNIMVYMGLGVTDIFNENGTYKGKYKFEDGTTVVCTLVTEPTSSGGVKATGAYYEDEDGNAIRIPGTTVNDMNDRLNNLTEEIAIADLMKITPPTADNGNAIMIFLAFSVADVQPAGENQYTGKYYPPAGGDPVDCWLVSKNGEITDVYYMVDGESIPVEKTSIAGVSSQVGRLSNVVKLKDIIKIDQSNKVLVKLGEYTVGNVQNAINELTLDDFMEVTVSSESDTSEVVLSYIVYGITNIEEGAGEIQGKEYTHKAVYNGVDGSKSDCYLVVEDGKIKEAFLIEGEQITPVKGTTVNDVQSRVSGVTRDLTIGQLMDVKGNRLLEMISGATIENLPSYIDNLAVNELYADNIYAINAQESEGYTAQRYLAVSVSEMAEAQSFNEDYIYYVIKDGNYVLASTTGKLKAFESGETYYTCGEGKILFNTAYLYYTLDEDGKNYSMVEGGNRGKVTVFEENKYYTYGAANAMWQLLLYNEGSETAFSVNGLNSMITNVSSNTKSANMYTLHEAGILTFDDPSELDKVIDYYGTPTKIGDLELGQLVGLFVYMTDLIKQPVIPGM